jgi:[ribosomal protein S5]-alanine N-acetyltransferase
VRPFSLVRKTLHKVNTQRLTLIAATAEIARADVADRSRFGELLDAAIPPGWPTHDMKDVQELFAGMLERGDMEPAFGPWYVVMNGVLSGSLGSFGNPDADGAVTIGYGVVPELEGRGVATEALAGLIDWLRRTGRVRIIRATTFERHFASVRILEKNGFTCCGVSPEDAGAAEADRQGRGRLMIWER